MDTSQLVLMGLAVGVIAFLYSSVGHAGASGYIAVMSLFGLATTVIRPTALVLNILVASIGAFQFWRAGHFSWRLFWPFAVLAVPAAFLGGMLKVPSPLLKVLLGLVLLYSAVRLFRRQGDPAEVAPPRTGVAMVFGAVIGLLSGMTGTGGGIFLTPLLLFCHWSHTRTAAAVSAMFILVNSVSGLLGQFASGQKVPAFAWGLAVAAVAGGTAGSYFGSRKFPVRAIHLLLAAVLVIASVKLLGLW
jgi:uncharacterized membrane protein YfcA